MSVDVRIRTTEDSTNKKLNFELHLDKFGATPLELAAAQTIFPRIGKLLETITQEVEASYEGTLATSSESEQPRIIVP